ncbi:MAG: MOSC domain-containing protein [Leptolyngbyaceae cyanobacterium SL_7_1]|nr:MOSC domain-containing protein [Leptolyngbyaceae cyanobacterium SL_7_1]
MRILQLFRKSVVDGTQQALDRLTLTRGMGIVGDSHAQVGSPRQVLFVSQPVLDRFSLQPGDLWENILVDGEVEALTSGQVLQIGSARIRLTFDCEPCYLLDRVRSGLSKQLEGQRGMLGMVVADGEIRVGDEVVVVTDNFPAIPTDLKSRLYGFIQRIPVGRVVRSPQLILAIGAPSSTYRVLPVLLKKAPTELPVHRTLTATGQLWAKHLPHQAEWLRAEGVEIVGDRIVDSQYEWSPTEFYAML